MLSLLLQIPTTLPTSESAVDFTWLFIKMLLALGIVSVAAVLVLKYAVPHIGVMKRFQRGRHFKVIGHYTLESKKTLYLVQIGRRYLVLGAAENGISLVTEVSEGEIEEHHPSPSPLP